MFDIEECKKHSTIVDRYCSECNLAKILNRKEPFLQPDDIKYQIRSYHMSPDKEDLYTLNYVCRNNLKRSCCDES